MKKNAIGHRVAAREDSAHKLSRWRILPKILCLLLALVVWLAITQLTDNGEAEEPQDSETVTVDS